MEILIAALLILGASFMLIAAIGILKMPDLYMRMSVNTKSVTLGMGFLLLALVLHFHEIGVASRALATLVFIAMTAPISSHLIGRAAYLSGVELWSETRRDELGDLYQRRPMSMEQVLFSENPPHSMDLEQEEKDTEDNF